MLEDGCVRQSTKLDAQGCLIFRNGVDHAESGEACGHGSEEG